MSENHDAILKLRILGSAKDCKGVHIELDTPALARFFKVMIPQAIEDLRKETDFHTVEITSNPRERQALKRVRCPYGDVSPRLFETIDGNGRYLTFKLDLFPKSLLLWVAGANWEKVVSATQWGTGFEAIEEKK